MVAAVPLPLIFDHRPRAVEVDELSIEFCRLKSQVDEAYRRAVILGGPMEAFREKLVLLVEEFGAPHAKKSKLLVGVTSELIATFGSTRTIDDAAVEEFRNDLKRAGRTRILAKLFTECTIWRLVAGADSIIRGEQISDQLSAQFARCFIERRATATLKVRMK